MSHYSEIQKHLGTEAENLLGFNNPKIKKDQIHSPRADWVDHAFSASDRNNRVLANLQRLYGSGRLANTGYVSILPVDQGIEHSAGASFAKNPIYFDGENIVKLAIEGGCNAVCSTFGVLSSVSRRYAHKIPFMVKINHNQLLTYPNVGDQVMYGTLKQAADMGCAAVGATIYFGSAETNRQIIEVSHAFQQAHELGMATVLWCYTRNNAFKTKEKDFHVSADLTGQANHLGVTICADIIKQKLPENNGGYLAIQATGVDQADAAHVAVGDLVAGEVDRVVGREVGVHALVDLAVRGLGGLDREVAERVKQAVVVQSVLVKVGS